jgi:hypothetical protein
MMLPSTCASYSSGRSLPAHVHFVAQEEPQAPAGVQIVARRVLNCQSVCLSSATRYPKEHCFFGSSLASPACPSDNSIKTKMSVERWYCDTDRETPKYCPLVNGAKIRFLHHWEHCPDCKDQLVKVVD